MYRTSVILLATVLASCLGSSNVAWADCPSGPSPLVTGNITTHPDRPATIRVQVSSRSAVVEYFTVVADFFTERGQFISHSFSPPTLFQPGESQSFVFPVNVPATDNYYVQAGIYDNDGCERFSEKILELKLAGRIGEHDCLPPTPIVSGTITFCPAQPATIRINVINTADVPSYWTVVADLMTEKEGKLIQHLYSTPTLMSPLEFRQFVFQVQVPEPGDYYINVEAVDGAGCQAVDQKMMQFKIVAPCRICPPDCAID